MNITELKVGDFGAWHELSLTDLSRGVTVFYGPNEAGKTTLLNLIRTILYGFSDKRCERYLPPAFGDRAGGTLTIDGLNGQFTIERFAPAMCRGGAGDLSIRAAAGGTHGVEFLTSILSGVDETIFNNVFAVGLTQIQQLATLSDTEAANQLYGLATGVDRVSLFEVSRELERQRDLILPSEELLSSRDSEAPNPGTIQSLLEQRDRLQKELKALRRDEGHYAALRREYRNVKKETKDKEQTKKLIDQHGDWPQVSERLRQHWSTCVKINDRLEQIGPVAAVPAHAVKRVNELYSQIREQRNEWEELCKERKCIKQQAAKLKGLDTLYEHAAEIEALDRQRPRIVSLEKDLEDAQATANELEFELKAELEELGLQTGTSAKQFPLISDQVIEALRVPARETRELRETVEALKKLAEQKRKEAEATKGQLETVAVRFGGKNVASIIEKGHDLVTKLERRIALDEQRDSIVRRLDEMEDEAKYWHGRSVLPWAGVLTTCAVFSAGMALLIIAVGADWFSVPGDSRAAMMWIGGPLAVVSLIIKWTFENTAEERADRCEQQIDALYEEQNASQAEAIELDEALPSAQSPRDQQLADARQELAEIDQFLPLTHHYETLLREAEAADHQATLAVRQLKESRRGWKASLRTVGLPDSLTPAQVGKMSGRVSEITHLRHRMNEANRLCAEKKEELSTIKTRLEELFVVGEVTKVPDDLGPQLARLAGELQKHLQSGKQREELKERFDSLGDKQRRIAATAQQLYATRGELLAYHGISDVNDLRETQQKTKKSAKLRAERDHLLSEIEETLGDRFSITRLRKLLDQRADNVIEHISRTDRERKSLDADLKRLYQRGGELKQKLDGHMQDVRADRKALELNVLEERLEQSARYWHRAAVMSAVLENVKHDYETKRQPVALAEASRHLERLTEGRYTRIWTPMSQNSLCIDDSNETALPVEKLSRGTRELVFLSLRLALVSSYNRRGASMPVILDDVFVNFDDQRAEAAAKVLSDVAKEGQQMLIFTCHQRIRAAFAELNADVRDLPVRKGLRHGQVGTSQPDTSVTEITPKQEPSATDKPSADIVESALPAEVGAPGDLLERTEDTLGKVDEPELDISSEQLDVVYDDVESEWDEAEERQVDQFKPAWRDEWLDPLPDLSE